MKSLNSGMTDSMVDQSHILRREALASMLSEAPACARAPKGCRRLGDAGFKFKVHKTDCGLELLSHY